MARRTRRASAFRSVLADALRGLLGLTLGFVARVWLGTLRLQVEVHPALAAMSGVPWVLVFFHGTQWPLLAWRGRKRTIVLVSLSNDGAIQARALRTLGFAVTRGSSSRGGARGLASLVRRAEREGLDAAFAVDGPRGPYGSVKPGALWAAGRLEGVIVPIGSAAVATRSWTLTKAWDKFVLAWPFSRVAVVLGAPFSPPSGAAMDAVGALRGQVEAAIRAANARAKAILAEGSGTQVDCPAQR